MYPSSPGFWIPCQWNSMKIVVFFSAYVILDFFFWSTSYFRQAQVDTRYNRWCVKAVPIASSHTALYRGPNTPAYQSWSCDNYSSRSAYIIMAIPTTPSQRQYTVVCSMYWYKSMIEVAPPPTCGRTDASLPKCIRWMWKPLLIATYTPYRKWF